MAQIIEKEKDKKYMVRIFTGRDTKGKRAFYNKMFTGTKSEARKFAREKETARDKGLPLEPQTMSVNDYLDRWLKHSQKHVRPNTHTWYCDLMQRYVRPSLGNCRLAQVKPLDIEDLYAKLLGQGLSGRTVRHVHARLCTAFKQAMKWEVLLKNPASLATAPGIEKKEMHFLAPDEAARFVKASRECSHGVLLRFALSTGMRPEEFLGLQWKELDLDNAKRGVARVRRAMIWILDGGGWEFGKLKSKASERDVYFPLQIARELQEHKRKQLEERLKLGQHYQNNDLVFPTKIGTPLHRKHVTTYWFKPTLKRAELPETIRLYDLRHSYVTLSLLSGVKPKTVSEQAGHSSVEFTLDHYAHVLKEEREGASDQLENLLFSGVVTL
ncbi:MAG: tyrosine-type recombinase/integrase [Pyrinomonadaceae bacterium]